MGNWWYPIVSKYQDTPRKLCDDLVDDETDFVVNIWVYAAVTPIDLRSTMEHLQHTHPLYSYTCNKNITLIYSSGKKPVRLRSNVSGEIISSLTYEVTNYLLKNRICDPYAVEVSISTEKSDLALKKLLEYIAENKYAGSMFGIDNLSAQKIKEQFS